MSQKYPGGFITKTPTAPTASAAPGIWTLDQAMQNQKAGNWPSPPSPYIEDYFSTYLYTGNGSTQTITNGINLSANGGLVWIKSRGQAANHRINDTAAAVAGTKLAANTTAALAAEASGLTSFNSNGFSIGSDGTINTNADPLVSWTFAERQKFFDIVTYTGNGVSGRTLAHSLGSVPGCMIVKSTSNADDWIVYHRGLSSPTTSAVYLNSVSAVATGLPYFPTTPTATDFYLAGSGYSVNQSGQTYVAYLFAHDAGGFGLTGSDNVISCGSFTTDGSGNIGSVNLGYEPQWILTKRTDNTQNWYVWDTMRGDSLTSQTYLSPNLTTADNTSSGTAYIYPTATGFAGSGNWFGLNATAIYIAIRRGPMKVPTVGTTVFTPATRTGTSATANITSAGFPVDLGLIGRRNTDGLVTAWDRLRGATKRLITSGTGAESSTANGLTGFDSMTGFTLGDNNTVNDSTYNYVDWNFRRAPGFFDEVCYTGTGSATTFSHNLGVAPEMMIVKSRSNGALGWYVYSTGLGPTKCNVLNQTDGQFTSSTFWNDTAPTSSVFTLGSGGTNGSGNTQVAYLFATCPGVSKVGSYTGNGASQTINCGFTTGSRFVLIKRTDTTSDWYVWDSARGIVAGNDPYLLLNSTAAEVTGTDAVDTDSTGFIVNRLVAVDVNENAGTYIFLAIA